MKRYQSILFILVSTLLFFSCSKERILAKRLDGTWHVDVYQKTVYGNGTPVPYPESASVANAGDFDFYSDGTGKFVMVKNLGQDTFQDKGEFIWTNTGESVSIRITGGTTKKFDVVTNKKDKMVWERSQVYYFSEGESGVNYTMDERMTLTK